MSILATTEAEFAALPSGVYRDANDGHHEKCGPDCWISVGYTEYCTDKYLAEKGYVITHRLVPAPRWTNADDELPTKGGNY